MRMLSDIGACAVVLWLQSRFLTTGSFHSLAERPLPVLAEFVHHLPNEFPRWLVSVTVKYKNTHIHTYPHTHSHKMHKNAAHWTPTDAHSSPMRDVLSILTVESDVSSWSLSSCNTLFFSHISEGGLHWGINQGNVSLIFRLCISLLTSLYLKWKFTCLVTC